MAPAGDPKLELQCPAVQNVSLPVHAGASASLSDGFSSGNFRTRKTSPFGNPLRRIRRYLDQCQGCAEKEETFSLRIGYVSALVALQRGFLPLRGLVNSKRSIVYGRFLLRSVANNRGRAEDGGLRLAPT
jgi:hypothetical protein